MNPFEFLIVGIGVFIILRVWWWSVQVGKGHAKDEAICEKCWGKRRSDNVTEQMEWCHCPQKEDSSDRHYEEEPEKCTDCNVGDCDCHDCGFCCTGPEVQK